MIQVKIDVSGAVAKLKRVGVAFDQRRALTEIGNSVLTWIDQGFGTGGHGKWARLSPNTVAAKGHSQPLVETGKLAGSFRSKVSGDRVTIGTADPKAPFHEYGTKAHMITAGGRVMRFRTVDGPVAARSVDHPGNPPRPMLPDEATARDLAMGVINKLVRSVTKAA